MVDFEYKQSYTVEDLRRIVAILRAPGGCPWDMVQTHESIRRNLIEEAYEAAEAIEEGSCEHMKEELGDVLLQVLFHASIEEDAGNFDLDGVADGICKKLIFRHPHVFGTVEADTEEKVLVNWDELKRQEKGQETYTDTLRSVANNLPALWRAEKIQKKAAKSGFEWPDVNGALDKLEEECGELRQAAVENSNIEEELGDLLFASVKAALFLNVDPEEALRKACEKYISRFDRMEQVILGSGRRMEDVGAEELISVWNRIKHLGETK